MPQTAIFFKALGLGENRIAEILAPVSIRRLTLCFSIVSITQRSSAFMEVTGACMGGLRTHHCGGGSGLGYPGNRGHCAFHCFPLQMGQGPSDSFLHGHSLLKWPGCPYWKHVLGFGLCLREAYLITVIRASCHLSFLFSFCMSFFSFSKSLL
jgi:hypothetical protein